MDFFATRDNELNAQLIAKNDQRHEDSISLYPGRSLPILWLFAIACLNIIARIPQLGHMLSWDEAWNLCALKSIASGSGLLAGQFWRHPPVYMEFGFLLSPLRSGFEMRMEILSLVLSIGAILIFVSMISEFFGKRIAVFTGIAYALMPGALFFDTWVKRDSVATLFSILAVWAFLKHRDTFAGILLGLGLLGKETALFYCGAIFMLAVFLRGSQNWHKRLLVTFGIALLASGGWYLFMAQGTQGFVKFFFGTSAEANGFSEPWWYYPAKLRYDLGWPGVFLLGGGILAMFPGRTFFRNTLHSARKLKHLRYLPIFLLAPGYAVLSISSGKPPWMTIVLNPVLALLVGFGWALIMRCLAGIIKVPVANSLLRIDVLLPAVLLILTLGIPVARFNYNDYFLKIAPGQYEIATTSQGMVSSANKHVKDGESILILPMYYRNNNTMPDPIFFWNLKVSPQIIRGLNPGGYDEFRNAIIANQINWVFISPAKGSKQEEIVLELIKDIDPVCSAFSKGALVKVDSLWR